MPRLVVALVATLALACVEDVQVLGTTGTADPGVPAGPRPDLLYRLDEGAGTRILDSAGSGELVHLRVASPEAVERTPTAVRFDGRGIATSERPPTAFIDACRRSNEVSIEAWVTPMGPLEEGTRRIVTLSNGSAQRNFTLGTGALFNEGPLDAYTLRVRTTGTDGNGLPGLSSEEGSLARRLTHVVAVHDAQGQRLIYIDGRLRKSDTLKGDLSNWARDHRLSLGDEVQSDDPRRAFIGEIHLVALYAAALTSAEVQAHFVAGPTW